MTNSALILGFPSLVPAKSQEPLDSTLNGKGLAISLLPVTLWCEKSMSEGSETFSKRYHNSWANHAELSPLRTRVYLSQHVTLGHHCRRSGSISSWRLDCMSFRPSGIAWGICAHHPHPSYDHPRYEHCRCPFSSIHPSDKGARLWGHWSSKATHSWLALSNQRTRSRTRSWNGVGRRGSRSSSEETRYQ